MWPTDAKNTLLRAVCGAFNTHTLKTRRNIHIVSEPEASALYIIQDVLRQRSGPMQAVRTFFVAKNGINVSRAIALLSVMREAVLLYVLNMTISKQLTDIFEGPRFVPP